jgi:hypothetical protein
MVVDDMSRRTFALVLAAGCGSSSPASPDAAGAPDGAAAPDASSGLRTLANCTTNIAADAPAFYKKYFRCVTVTTTSTGVTIVSDDLPPHTSYYWGAGNPNYVAWDARGGTYHANPNTLSQQSVSVGVPSAPTPLGITITSDYVDSIAGDNSAEYRGGPVGVALDGVSLYGGFAAPGDLLSNEIYTLDTYDGHPDQRGSYHYHSPTPGPIEALTAEGVTGVELYGVMCDGTIVLGCTELDGSAPAGALDAQGGHTGDVGDGTTIYFSSRYHVHVCADGAHGYQYTPEIHYYGACK